MAEQAKTPEQIEKERQQKPRSPTADRPAPLGPMMADKQRFWAKALRRREAEADNP